MMAINVMPGNGDTKDNDESNSNGIVNVMVTVILRVAMTITKVPIM